MRRTSPWTLALALATAATAVAGGCQPGSEAAPVEVDMTTGPGPGPADDRDQDGFPRGEDCDDEDPRVYPGQREFCGDGIDQDCDGIDPPCDDDDDGFTEDEGDCDDDDANVYPEGIETCEDGVDQDCDGRDQQCDERDQDHDGVSPRLGDCDDTNPEVFPGAAEQCGDGHDSDCDNTDPPCPEHDADGDDIPDAQDVCPEVADPFQSDMDADGHGDFCDNCMDVPNPDQADADGDGEGDACSGAADADGDGVRVSEGDCDDHNPAVLPGAPEAPDACDGVDNDCNLFPDDRCPSDLRSALVAVPEGETLLGSTLALPGDCEAHEAERDENCDEIPQRRIRLSAFEVEVTEVSNRQYKACVDAGQCSVPYRSENLAASLRYENPVYADYPVVFVSQGQAVRYCTFAGRRLPTEAEWERAARGDAPLVDRVYPWGDEVPDCERVNAGGCRTEPEAVGTRDGDVTALGVHDLVGNVAELVAGYYAPAWYSALPDGTVDPQPPQQPVARDQIPVRGGHAQGQLEFSTITYRGFGFLMEQAQRRAEVGFRCVR